MPFKSEKQRRYLWAKHPDIAQRWADEEKRRNHPLVKHAKKKRKR